MHLFHIYEATAISHTQLIAGANIGEIVESYKLGVGVGRNVTRILYGCTGCAKVFVDEVKGTWTIEQVKATRGKKL